LLPIGVEEKKPSASTREDRIKRLAYIHDSIDRNYNKFLSTIRKTLPTAYNHEDLLQQSILNIIERLNKCIDGEYKSIIFEENNFIDTIEDFCDSFMVKSIKKEAVFVFINNYRKLNAHKKKEELIKDHCYNGDECLSFGKFEQNLELQEFYDTLPPEEIAIIRMLIDGYHIIEICKSLDIHTRKYYSIIASLKEKIVINNIVDPEKIKHYTKTKEKKEACNV